MTSIIAVIDGCAIRRMDDGRISFASPSSLDAENKPLPKGRDKDPDYAEDRGDGDSGKDRYVAISSKLLRYVPEITIGSPVTVYNNETKMFVSGVVGSTGWSKQLGGLSIAMANALGILSNEKHHLDITITPK